MPFSKSKKAHVNPRMIPRDLCLYPFLTVIEQTALTAAATAREKRDNADVHFIELVAEPLLNTNHLRHPPSKFFVISKIFYHFHFQQVKVNLHLLPPS